MAAFGRNGVTLKEGGRKGNVGCHPNAVVGEASLMRFPSTQFTVKISLLKIFLDHAK